MAEISHCYAVWIEGEEYIAHDITVNDNNEIEVYGKNGEIMAVHIDDTEYIEMDIG
jgi:nitrate reductase alpha subunit